MSTVRDNPTEHRYELKIDDQVAEFSDYTLDGERIAILHTEVDDTDDGRSSDRRLRLQVGINDRLHAGCGLQGRGRIDDSGRDDARP